MKAWTIFFLSVVVGCGERVSIQPGEMGRQLTISGLEDENRPPGAFRMESCIFTACPKLVRLQTQKSTKVFTIDHLFLPKSNVDMAHVEVGLQFQVKQDKASLDTIFKEVRPIDAPDDQSSLVLLISTETIYETYIQRKAPDAVITALREYQVDQVLSDVPEIASFTKDKINELLANTPVEVTELGFPNGIGQPPDEVLDAKRRLYAVEEQKARDIKALEAEFIIEKQRQLVQKLRTQNDLANAQEAGIDFATYVFLKNMERFAEEHVPLGDVSIPQAKPAKPLSTKTTTAPTP
jgi:SPFH domain / Band 7 family